MGQVKLGKLPARFDDRTLQFGAYLTKKLKAPPPAVDYSKAVKRWPMMKNDTYGDCTCAAAGHMIQEWTANIGREHILTDAQILTAYRYFAGDNPDAGANMLDVLKYWRKTGIGGDRITAFAELEPMSDTQARDAVFLFGACYIGVALPDFAVAGPNVLATPWVVPPKGPIGDAAPNFRNGHCIPAVAYDTRNLYIVTWGALKAMSWQFYLTYTEEAYAVLSTDWINPKGKKAPSGFDFATLLEDLAAVTSA